MQHIRNTALFGQLERRQQEAVAEAVQALRCQPGDVLAQQGAAVPGLLLLASGAARNGAELRAGDCYGEEALFGELRAEESLVVSAADTWVLLLRREAMPALVAQDAGLLEGLRRRGHPEREAEATVFRGQRRGERVLAMLRRHPWAWGYKALWAVLPALLLLMAAIVAELPAAARAGLALAALALPGLWLLYLVAEWHNDHLIITDRRVIRRERTILRLEETLAELPLESVHEVSVSIPQRDAFARMFNYGTVFIRTAGDSGNMILPMMAAPEGLQQMLLRNRLAFQRRLQERAQAALAGDGDGRASTPAPPGIAGQAAAGPLGTRFSDARGNLVYRKHLSVWLAHIFLPLTGLIGAATLTLIQVLAGVTTGPGLVGVLLSGSGIGAALLWLYWSDWDWRNDLLYIGQTTLRIIHRRPMWLQDHNEQFLLTQVDSVVINRSGPLNKLLNRGDLLISLVGDDQGAERSFRSVGRPLRVQDEISRQRAAVLARREESEALRRREEFATWIDAWQTRRQQEATPPAWGGEAP